MTKTFVFCSLQVEGVHSWPNCHIEQVSYLKYQHRHVFHIKAEKQVNHDDRDVEFIQLKTFIQTYLLGKFWSKEMRCCDFQNLSCEAIAEDLLNFWGLSKCEVSEDGENGAIVVREVIND